MPSRILREGILSSDRIESLDFPAEVFYRRLMSKVDDFGLFDARPSMLRTSLYPLRVDRVREADITRWIAACEKAGVIALYVHGGKPFGQMLDTAWQTRSEPKHPLPPWGRGEPVTSPVNSCAHPFTPATVFEDGDVVEDGDGNTPRKRDVVGHGDLVADGLAPETATEFIAHRKRRRAPITPRAWDGIKAEALKARLSLEEVADRMIKRNWTAFEAEWVTGSKPPVAGTDRKSRQLLSAGLMTGALRAVPQTEIFEADDAPRLIAS